MNLYTQYTQLKDTNFQTNGMYNAILGSEEHTPYALELYLESKTNRVRLHSTISEE